jgi:hypothetical protein
MFASVLATVSMCATKKYRLNDAKDATIYAMAPV